MTRAMLFVSMATLSAMATGSALAAPPEQATDVPPRPATSPKSQAIEGSAPAPPPYQMRAALPDGDRLADGQDGAALYSHRCGACHLIGGMGTNLLTKQRMLLGEPPENALLTNRKDLSQTYVRTVVRRGKLAMPGLTRVEVTDAELDAIAEYLGKAGP